MSRLWKWYQNSLSHYPLRTQVVSSGLIWGIGDITAQTITQSTAKGQHQIQAQGEDEEFKIDWQRVGAISLFGFAFVGPIGHIWYHALDRYTKTRLLLKPNSFRFVASKVAIEEIFFAPMDLLIFFSYMGFATGKSVPEIKEDVKRDFLPAYCPSLFLWPLQVVNFRYVPVRHQLLYVNSFCLLDSCFLSWIEQQEDAPWKQWLNSFVKLNKQEGGGG